MSTVVEGRQARQEAVGARRRQLPLGERIVRVVVYLILVAGAIVLMFPLYWLVTSSVKSLEEINAFPPMWVPTHLQWDNYPTLFQTLPFWTYFKNTLTITLT